MQLTSKDGNMVVDFYPVKFATGEIHNRLMLKVVTFCDKTQSKSYINKKDFQRELDSRIEGYGYKVTNGEMLPQLFNSAMGMAWWFMSLIKHYLHQIMTETQDKIIDRDALQANLINQILDDMDIKTMMAILYDNMDESYDKYSVDELIEEVEEYYPHLLEDWSKGGSPKASP